MADALATILSPAGELAERWARRVREQQPEETASDAVFDAVSASLIRMVADGDAGWLSEDVPLLLGRPARSFEEFATDYASAFS